MSRKPATHAKGASPRSGVVPPPEHRWRPGQSGNPAGKPRPAGWQLREWLNHLADATEAELRRVVDNPKEPAAKATAAQLWLNARSGERSKSGVPLCGEAAERIMDQTAGKPVQAIELSGPGESVQTALGFDETALAVLFAAQRARAVAACSGDSDGLAGILTQGTL